jgi:hypothetical protein
MAWEIIQKLPNTSVIKEKNAICFFFLFLCCIGQSAYILVSVMLSDKQFLIFFSAFDDHVR